MHDPLTDQYTAEEIRIAQIVHKTICALQDEQDDECPAPPWASAPGHMRLAALDGVRRAMAGETPAQHHQAWCDYKTARGWTYGDRKDYDALTHPCLRPFDQLPRHQQVKDMVFIAVVKALAGGADGS